MDEVSYLGLPRQVTDRTSHGVRSNNVVVFLFGPFSYVILDKD